MKKAIVFFLSVIVLLYCSPEPQPRPSSSNTVDTIEISFLYFPARNKMEITIAGDSITVIRKNALDSCIESTKAILQDTAAFFRDSLVKYISKIRGGTYKRELVIDGTKIWIRFGPKHIFCDNCLHEYVVEKAGAVSGPKSEKIRRIKEAVSYANQIVPLIEKKTNAPFRKIEVLRKPAGSTKDYIVNFLDTQSRSQKE